MIFYMIIRRVIFANTVLLKSETINYKLLKLSFLSTSAVEKIKFVILIYPLLQNFIIYNTTIRGLLVRAI